MQESDQDREISARFYQECQIVFNQSYVDPTGDHTAKFIKLIEFGNSIGYPDGQTQFSENYVNDKIGYANTCNCEIASPLILFLKAGHFRLLAIGCRHLPNSQIVKCKHGLKIFLNSHLVNADIKLLDAKLCPPKEEDRRMLIMSLSKEFWNTKKGYNFIERNLSLIDFKANLPPFEHPAFRLKDDVHTPIDSALNNLKFIFTGKAFVQKIKGSIVTYVPLYTKFKSEEYVVKTYDMLLEKGYFKSHHFYMAKSYFDQRDFPNLKKFLDKTNFDLGELNRCGIKAKIYDFPTEPYRELTIPPHYVLSFEASIENDAKIKEEICEAYYHCLKHIKPWSPHNAAKKYPYENFNQVRLLLLCMNRRGFLSKNVINYRILPLIYDYCMLMSGVKLIQIPDQAKVLVRQKSIVELQTMALRKGCAIILRECYNANHLAICILVQKLWNLEPIDESKVEDNLTYMLRRRYKKDQLLLYAAYERLAPIDEIPTQFDKLCRFLAKNQLQTGYFEDIDVELVGLEGRKRRATKRLRDEAD